MRFLFWMRGPLREEEGGEGVGGGGTPAFDPVKFRSELMADIAKLVAKGSGSGKKKETPPPNTEVDDEEDHGDDPDPKKKDAATIKHERELAKLRADLDAEKTARRETESKAKESSRLGAIRGELGKHTLNPDSVDDAFRYFRDEVHYDESGNLVAGPEDQPLDEFIKATVSKKATWQPPKQVSGAGASSGGRGAKPVDLEQINAGMSKETRDRAWASVRDALNGL